MFHALYQASSLSGASESAAAAAATDNDDPEVQFLMSLTPKQKKRLLKYVLHFFCSSLCCILFISLFLAANINVLYQIYVLMVTQVLSFNSCCMFQQEVREDGEEEEEEEEG